MTVGPVGSDYYIPYMSGSVSSVASSGAVNSAEAAAETKPVVNPGESTVVAPGKKSSPAQCETCKNRKYQDGSNEMVSYKAPTHISAGASAGKVMAHEQEHVANAYSKAANDGGKVVQASVQLKTAVCPECGRAYVAGGETTTKIKYPADKFSQNKKSYDALATVGGNFDAAV